MLFRSPDGVTSIGNRAFSGCTSLTSVLVNENNASYSSDGVALYNKDKSLLITVPGGVTSFVIPDSVTSIGEAAFKSCTNLESITIPDSVTSIGEYAFNLCTSLTSVTIPDSVTSIANRAFSDCTSFTSVHFNGTKTQWEAVHKVSWDYKTGDYTIYCTDGNITK